MRRVKSLADNTSRWPVPSTSATSCAIGAQRCSSMRAMRFAARVQPQRRRGRRRALALTRGDRTRRFRQARLEHVVRQHPLPHHNRAGPVSKLRWILLGVALLLLAMGAALTWLLDSPAGARWAAGAAAQLLHGELTIQTVRGTLVGPLEVSRLRYHDPQSGLDVQLERATIDVALRELLVRRVYVENLALDGLTLRLGKATQNNPSPSPCSRRSTSCSSASRSTALRSIVTGRLCSSCAAPHCPAAGRAQASRCASWMWIRRRARCI